MLIRRLARWLDSRLGAARFARTALNKVFPDHWSFMIGEIALYCLVILILTGVYLTFFFVPDSREVVYHGSYAPLRGAHMSAAYQSTLRVSFDVRAGLVMRQIHHWAALIFIGSIIVHMVRIFFTGAFRRPRELNWAVGVTLLLLALANGFTGYSLPDDQLSGTGLRIAYSVLESVPFLGPWMAFLVFGGEFPSDDIISRLFTIHVLIVPALIVGLLSVHLGLLVRQKHTQFRGRGRTERNVVGSKLWPTFTAKTLGLFFFVFAVCAALGGLAQINPVWLYGPFKAQAVSSGSQPDWYIGWLEGALRLMPPWELRVAGFEIPNPFFPGVLLPGVTFAVIYAWPWIEQRFTKDRAEHHLLDRPRDRPVRTGLGVAVLTFYVVLFVAGGDDVIASHFNLSVNDVVYVFRGLVFVLPAVAYYVTYRLCKELSARARLPADELALLARTPEGGYVEVEPGVEEPGVDEPGVDEEDEELSPSS
ncbi:MAG TPA: ubiquinol-cytochrome c reductase cytochrome b subunit [Acidimicrobiia bacterium]|nr:ubiquinol-cytochrome c reductase cytochrome b subunit [Acidimicrobiia bacterium]